MGSFPLGLLAKIVGNVAFGPPAGQSKAAIAHLVRGAVAVLALALLSAFMGGTLLVGAHYALYLVLLSCTALTPLAAFGLTALVGIVITIVLVAATVGKLKSLFDIPRQVGLDYKEPIGTRAINVVESFVDGLTGRQRFRF